MPKYVYSTLTCAQAFTLWKEGENKNAPPRRLRQVIIEGGANLANKNLMTPRGAVTRVTDEDYNEILKEHKLFQSFLKDGRFVVHDKASSDPDKVYSKMPERDNHAPITAGATSGRAVVSDESDDAA